MNGWQWFLQVDLLMTIDFVNRVKANEYSYVINYANGGTIVVYRKSISIMCISYVIIAT